MWRDSKGVVVSKGLELVYFGDFHRSESQRKYSQLSLPQVFTGDLRRKMRTNSSAKSSAVRLAIPVVIIWHCRKLLCNSAVSRPKRELKHSQLIHSNSSSWQLFPYKCTLSTT
jgi:hypothetical protein